MRDPRHRADARGRSPDHRRRGPALDRADGERRPPGGGGARGQLRGPAQPPRRRPVRTRQQRRRRLRGGPHAGAARRGRVGVRPRPGGQRHRRRAAEPGHPGSAGRGRRGGGRRAVVGAARLGSRRLWPGRRRDRRHRVEAAARRPARDGGRRPQHARGAGRVDRPAQRPLRRHAARRRPRGAGGDDGDARLAQAPARAAAGRGSRRRRGDRRHRHPAGDHRGPARPLPRAGHARAGAPLRPATPGGLAQGRLRTS